MTFAWPLLYSALDNTLITTHFTDILNTKMNYYEDLLGLSRHPKCRKADYTHKKQLEFYGIDESDDEFRICYRFRKDTVKVLCELLGEEFASKSNANKAFSVEQRLCIALRYYTTGTFQRQVGDSEGASQSSMHQIITVTNYYYSSIPVTNEPHLASRESKSCLISGGNSS